MLVSKILQNIANHVEFSKEQHMLSFNDFVRANFEGGRRFFVQIASDCETVEQGKCYCHAIISSGQGFAKEHSRRKNTAEQKTYFMASVLAIIYKPNLT